MLAVEAVAKLEYLALPARERPEDLAQRLLAQRDLGLLVGQRQVLVGDEVAELRLVLVADRLLERDRGLRTPADVLDLVAGEVEIEPDLGGGRLAPELARSLRSERTILFSFSTTWTGIRIVRALSASARATACRIHQVA